MGVEIGGPTKPVVNPIVAVGVVDVGSRTYIGAERPLYFRRSLRSYIVA